MIRLRSGVMLAGITSSTGSPRALPNIASAMPVLPLVASRIVCPASRPSARAASSIPLAARSFTEPLGL